MAAVRSSSTSGRIFRKHHERVLIVSRSVVYVLRLFSGDERYKDCQFIYSDARCRSDKLHFIQLTR